jgi:hypothetical protein
MLLQELKDQARKLPVSDRLEMYDSVKQILKRPIPC